MSRGRAFLLPVNFFFAGYSLLVYMSRPRVLKRRELEPAHDEDGFEIIDGLEEDPAAVAEAAVGRHSAKRGGAARAVTHDDAEGCGVLYII